MTPATLPNQPPQPIQFELRCRKEARRYRRPKVDNTWADKADAGGEEWGERNAARYRSLPDRPYAFTPLTSTFPIVRSRADFLNKQQMDAGFVDWFFFPEAVPAAPNPNHCDMCRTVAGTTNLPGDDVA